MVTKLCELLAIMHGFEHSIEFLQYECREIIFQVLNNFYQRHYLFRHNDIVEQKTSINIRHYDVAQ